MANNQNTPRRSSGSRRRRRSKFQIFKEAYLPVILVAVIVILIVLFFANSIRRSNEEKEAARLESLAAVQASEAQWQRQDAEAAELVTKADILAAGYDYEAAIATVDSFAGDFYDFDRLIQARDRYVLAQDALVVWNDPSKVPNLACNALVYDAEKAYADPENKNVFRKNFITVSEFTGILDQLYEKGYVLVNMEDIVTATENADGTVSYAAGEILLPEGKKPLMLTQTHINYYGYMIDSNAFASRLVVDENGEVTCEMITGEGTVTGAFDLVPILNAFIKEHPDFSYRGARAILAVTGYEGIFGYRINPDVKQSQGIEFYDEQAAGAAAVADALRASGYTLACHTYNNQPYGDISAEKLQADLDKWIDNISPVIGETDAFVFARTSDIAGTGSYSGEKYTILKNAGFRYYYGFCDDSNPWIQISPDHVRQGRLVITGSALTGSPELFTDFFNVEDILDPHR